MLIKVSENTWTRFLNAAPLSSTTQTRKFLEVGAKCSRRQIVYFIWSNNEGVQTIGFAALEKQKTLTQPIYNLYHNFLIGHGIDEEALAEDFYLLFTELKSRYLFIRLRLPPAFKYIDSLERAQVFLRYKKTYVKSLDNLKYSRNLHRIINRGLAKDYKFIKSDKFGSGFTEILNHNRKFWSLRKRRLHRKLLESLLADGIAEVYELWKSSELSGAIYIFRDDFRCQVQTMFLTKRNGNEEAHTLLYHLVMAKYKEKGFESCDFLGANIPQIAWYKAKFKGDLVSYCEVEICGGAFYKLLRVFRYAVGI
ncbi:GNAT family N-acetyltransferase [Desertivirga brevis]|uniref:GNAT family N-acetyltransferase n=1 Tax=Desertivirga brevis TaxID=2810310 RepID=UPI001A966001|nr:GNAT family N-acetyltransferase [Pedobacter sp. SYSU D00873]